MTKTITFCDLCGKEMKAVGPPASTNLGAYYGGRNNDIIIQDCCPDCANEIMGAIRGRIEVIECNRPKVIEYKMPNPAE